MINWDCFEIKTSITAKFWKYLESSRFGELLRDFCKSWQNSSPWYTIAPNELKFTSYSVVTAWLSFLLSSIFFLPLKVHFFSVSCKKCIRGFLINLDNVFSLIKDFDLTISASFIIFPVHSSIVGNVKTFQLYAYNNLL